MLIMTALLALTGGGVLGVSLLLPKFTTGNIGLSILLTIATMAIVFLSQAWGQTALLYAIKDSREKIGVIESYRRGWRKIVSYWWLSFLAGLINFGGFLLLIVPGIIISVWFSLAAYILVAENLTGMNALLKSREYVRGKWSGVLWRFLFIWGILVILLAVLSPIFSLLKIPPIGLEIGRFVVWLFLTPLAITYSFLIYNSLKAFKGNFAFVPTTGNKTAFIIIGIIGILSIPVVLFLTILLPSIFLQLP